MENSIYIGLSKQMVLRTDMQIIANNVANMSTPGYRAQNLVFDEFISKPQGEHDPMSFVFDKKQYQNTQPGSLSFTGNPLDIALEGPGFIGIQAPGGEIAYSRAGNFQMDAEGTLLNSAGYPVADTGGGSITIPPGSTDISIDEKGVVSDQDGQLGQIMVAEFDNLQTLDPMGDTLYTTTSAPLPPEHTRVKQGLVEGSNVKPVIEMTRMIDTLRSYQSVQRLLQNEHDRLRSAIQKLTREG